MRKKKYRFDFECQMCGKCCREEGYVYFKRADIINAAKHLGMSNSDFMRKYLSTRDGFSVHIVFGGGKCAFLNPDNSCAINSAKPEQCESFPYWAEYIGEDGSLVNFNRPCPGVSRE